MSNLRPLILSLLTLFVLTFGACEKVELPSSADPSGNSEPQEEHTPADTTATDTTTNLTGYSVSNVIQQEYESPSQAYVIGYIVGYVSGNTMKSCMFEAGDVVTNLLLADIPVETDPNRCIPVQLTNSPVSCRETRDALNLAHHPEMLHQKVRLQGNIATYMKVPGIKEAKHHTLLPDDFDYEAYYASLADTTHTEEPTDTTHTEEPADTTHNEQPTDTIAPQPDPDDEDIPTLADTLQYVCTHGTTEDVPYRVMDFKTYLPTYLAYYGATGMKDSYVCGYIVGYIKGQSIQRATFAAGDVATNIVLADSPDETNPDRCIAVQLTTSSNLSKSTREALNLATHPENLGRQVTLYGNIDKYMGTLGIKNARWCQFAE